MQLYRQRPPLIPFPPRSTSSSTGTTSDSDTSRTRVTPAPQAATAEPQVTPTPQAPIQQPLIHELIVQKEGEIVEVEVEIVQLTNQEPLSPLQIQFQRGIQMNSTHMPDMSLIICNYQRFTLLCHHAHQL